MILFLYIKQVMSIFWHIIFINLISLLFYSSVSFSITDEQFNKINSLIENQNIEKSFELIKIYQAGENKLTPKALLLFGKIYLELENPQKAFEYFDSVIFSSASWDEHAYAGMARAEFMVGNLISSKKLAEAAIDINPNFIDAKVILAQVLSSLNDNERSKQLFLSSMNNIQNSTYPGRMYVETLLRKNQINEAEKILKKTVLKNKTDAPSLELFSDIYWLKGDKNLAITFREKAKIKYIESGNIIKANKIINWLNYATVKDNEKNEIKEDDNLTIKETKLNFKNNHNDTPDKSNKNELKPIRKVFSPKGEPEEIYIDTNKPVFTGSGIILNGGNWILTNRHVVENLKFIKVRNGLGEVRSVKNQILSNEDDLAILILNKPFNSDYSIEMTDFKTGETGSSIYVIGYPMASLFGSFHPSITEGIITNPFGFDEGNSEFQISAKINPGNSGGAIFNRFGQIVGIASGKLDSHKIYKEEGFIPDGINLAIKIENVISFLKKNNIEQNYVSNNAYEYNIEELYKYMRSAIVFIVAQR